MPIYGTPQAGGTPTALQPGDGMVLFAGEVVGAGVASIPFARGFSPGGGAPPIVFTASWTAGAPSIQGSNVDDPAQYVTLNTMAASPDFYADLGGFAFYRALSAGGTVTMRVQR
jgi:hypothetical protein